MPDNKEQENLSTEEVVSLLTEDSPQAAPGRKGYADYVKEAADEAATSTADDDKGDEGDKDDDSGFKMPDKFAGKSAEEIAASYVELQSEYGRRNTEVGSLRKLTDQLLELKTDAPKTDAAADKPVVDVDSLLNNPEDTINSAVDGNPRIKALEDKLVVADRAADLKVFEDAHPDWEAKMGTQEFATWVLESPVRQRLFTEANTNYDYVTGAELLDMYNLSKGDAVKDATDKRNTDARKAAKESVTESGGNGEPKGKPKFRREELIQLKLRNPQKYEAMKTQIMEAYADKRVI